ncbi:consortin, connexin sorting protein b [Salminus brasiliensis]|uniref:consortin, connexin sorting protein b n=1 Tax=Salminus brasiliensis TaxID=930266 RepID=UPI003B832B19
MGDPNTEEAMRGKEDSTTVGSGSKEAIINSYLSVSDKTQMNLKETEAMDWGAVKEDLMRSNLEEKPGDDFAKLSVDGSASGHFGRAPGPSPSLLAALHSLGEHSDHMLLPHSLHQIAEAYFLEEDYPWAVQFLRLERLYHERLLSNLASLQKEWESQWRADAHAKSSTPAKTECSDTESKRMDSLSHICRTHQRPTRSMEKDGVDLALKHSPKQVTEHSGMVQKTSSRTQVKTMERTEDSPQPRTEPQEEEEEEEEDEEEEDEGLIEELQEDAGGEPVYGEELAKLIEVEEMSPPNGLVSILKRRAALEEDGPAKCSPSRSSYKRRVRFRETDDALDSDEVGGASCLIFLLLCLVTVVISMGGTALYCVLSGAYSNVCTDFSQNIDFYFGPVRRSMDTITHWFTPSTS